MAWSVVFPVKVLSAAKTRLGDRCHRRRASWRWPSSAMRCWRPWPPRGWSWSSWPRATSCVRATAEAAGALVVDDHDHPGINAAARWGARHSSDGRGVAVIVSDLPCLTPGSLETALAAAEPYGTSFLADLDGTGTTMWFATAPNPVDPRFGADSRAAHLAAGDADLVALNPGLLDRLLPARCDVDTDHALDRARALGVGSATLAALDVGTA